MLELRGLVVATVLPFEAGGAVDWASYRRLLDHCAVPDDVAAVFVNGHAGEGAALDADERSRVIRETRAAVREKPLLAGVIARSTAEACAEAAAALRAGADGIVLFPLPAFQAGGTLTPRAPVAYVRAVAAAARAPISIFQQPLASGLGYTTGTLVEMAAIPEVVAIKEGSDSMAAYEDNWRHLKAAHPTVAVLPSNFEWFLAQLAVGGDGILSGLASLAPAELARLWRAAEAGDLGEMRAAADRLYPLVRTIYARPPRMDMHTRIKAALRHLGVIARADPRPPLLPLDAAVEAEIAAATTRAEIEVRR